jgi:hypothetical protein
MNIDINKHHFGIYDFRIHVKGCPLMGKIRPIASDKYKRWVKIHKDWKRMQEELAHEYNLVNEETEL